MHPAEGSAPAVAAPRQVIPHDKLGVLAKIGQGGQGVVYRAPNVKTKFASSMVYKEYKAKARNGIDFTALAAMPALVERSLPYAEAETLISIAAWPCAVVEDGTAPKGFVMPAIPDRFYIPLTTVKGTTNTTAEFQHLLNHPAVLQARGIDIDDTRRYVLLREVASALTFLHRHGVCVGDISPKNLLFCLAPHEGVYFIDCDAMRINTVSALPQVETPGWNAPSGEELATIYTDTYKLGLLAVRLLAGDQSTTDPQHLPATTPPLLRQVITDTLNNQPQRRPLPEAWSYVLGNAVELARHAKVTVAPGGPEPAPPPIPTPRCRQRVHSVPPVRPSAPPHQTGTASTPPVGGDFWLDVGIDPIRIITSTDEFLTLRCYLDGEPIFLGNDGMINVFRSGDALRRYLAGNAANDMSTLCTYSDVTIAANDGSLPLDEVTDENFYVLKGLARDIAAGPRRVDRLKLELAIELLSDVGTYVMDTIVEDCLEGGQPLGELVKSVLARNYVVNPSQSPQDASSQWSQLEEFLQSRLRVQS